MLRIPKTQRHGSAAAQRFLYDLLTVSSLCAAPKKSPLRFPADLHGANVRDYFFRAATAWGSILRSAETAALRTRLSASFKLCFRTGSAGLAAGPTSPSDLTT